VTAPPRISFVVTCRPEAAFWLWTEAIGRWWPADHTVTGDPALVALEGRFGGRVYERGHDRTEHDWGRVTLWDPPIRRGYSWHIGRTPGEATVVEVRFTPGHDDTTIVEIEHSGWERFGDRAGVWRDRNRAGWDSLLPHLAAAATSSEIGAAIHRRQERGTGTT
jgi:Activator of Hsp90 ATPase homolog 1-like protein